jgi:hypothetical protein
VPTPGDLKTDKGEDEIGNLVAKEKTSETILVIEIGPSEAEEAFEISEHFLNPESLPIPGNSLFCVAEGGAKIPDTVTQAADDDVDGDRILFSVLDVGEDDWCPLKGIELVERQCTTSIVDEGVSAETNDKGEPFLLEPADEFSTAKAGIGQKQWGGLLGQHAGDQGAQTPLQFVLAVTETVGVVGAKSQG